MRLPIILEKFITAEGYTIASLSQKSGISISQLNLIIEDKLTPSTQTVLKLCRVLNITPNLIVDGNEATTVEVCTPSTRVAIEENSQVKYLSPTKTMRNMEPVMITLSAGEQSEKVTSEGEEFVYITKGEVVLAIGERELKLSCGDSTYYDSVSPHYYRSISEKSEILIVKHYSI